MTFVLTEEECITIGLCKNINYGKILLYGRNFDRLFYFDYIKNIMHPEEMLTKLDFLLSNYWKMVKFCYLDSIKNR